MSQVADVPEEMLRARRTAALARAAVGLCGLVLVVHNPDLVTTPAVALIGLWIIVITAFVQFALATAQGMPRWSRSLTWPARRSTTVT